VAAGPGIGGRLADGIANAAKFVQQVRWVLDECDKIGRDPRPSSSSTTRCC
jgi:hypothetical protein